MATQTITLDGRAYVIVPKDEYETLQNIARLPQFPDPLPDGNYPAGEYMRVSIARDIIKERTRLGLSQAELARLAGMRPETLNRIETGKVVPALSSLEKIEKALSKAGKNA